jgi:hypothetical protein
MLPILLLVLVLIITGVIARQGMLSAFLHMICVIAAGGIAFALWEPIGFAMLDSMGGFGAYAMGSTLVLTFLVALVILRLSMDKLVPENMNFESGANWAGSSIFGFVGAFISVGILTLGAGMLQFKSDFFGYTGWARDRATAQPGVVSSTPMFTAVYTARFYEMLSVGSLSPMLNGGALKQLYPEIDKMSWSMLRDGFVGDSGNGRSWLQPKSIELTDNTFTYIPNFASGSINPDFPRFTGAYVIPLKVNVSSFDNGSQFTMSNAQARLVAPAATSTGSPATAYPSLYVQPSKSGMPTPFAFDDGSNFVSNKPGTQALDFVLIFPGDELGPPLEGDYHLQIKGLRLELPEVQINNDGMQMMASLGGGAERQLPTGEGKALSGNDLKVDSEIPIRISYNAKGGLRLNDKNLIEGGTGQYNTGGPGGNVSKANRVTNFFEPEGTRIAQLTVGRRKPIDLDSLRQEGFADQPLLLVDENGNTYLPYGYIRMGREKTTILYNPLSPIETVNDLPSLPSSGNTELFILYRLPIGVTIQEVRCGTIPIGSTNTMVDFDD